MVMKLTKIKIFTIINGFLTLSGLAMLFSGLIIQMSESSDFDTTREALAATGSVYAMIFAGVLMVIGFGAIFFDDWAKLNNRHFKPVKIV